MFKGLPQPWEERSNTYIKAMKKSVTHNLDSIKSYLHSFFQTASLYLIPIQTYCVFTEMKLHDY